MKIFDVLENKDYPAGKFIELLKQKGCRLGWQLDNFLNMPLREYLASLIPKPNMDYKNRYRFIVANSLAQQLNRWGYEGVDEICDTLLHIPVIQQADHSNLLFDQETFLNNYFFHLSCREAGLRSMICWQCSTVSNITKRTPISGPVYLRTRGDLYKVFPFSNIKLTQSTFCCLPGPLKMSFELVRGTGVGRIDPFFNRFIGRIIPDAPTGYRICNDEIWDSINIHSKTRRIAVDESLSSFIISRHLEDTNSPITCLIFDHHVRDTFLSLKRQMIRDREYFTVNSTVPDFFWYKRGPRLVPMILEGEGRGAKFILESSNCHFPIPYDRKSFFAALNNGELYPDKLLIYFARCLLPKIIAIGGTSQQDYVAMYKELLIRTQSKTSFMDNTEINEIVDFNASLLGGAPLLELTNEEKKLIAWLGPHTNFDHFENSFINKKVGETIGTLECAKYFYKEFKKSESIKK